MIKHWIFFLLIGFVVASCGEYNKVFKSTDYEYKYKKAVEYYNSNDYARSTALLQDLVGVYRGTAKGADLDYYLAYSLYKDKDFNQACHYFRVLTRDYPRSINSEEAQFMIGRCLYELSPSAKLDQQDSRDAIDALQLYTNMFPFGKKVDEAKLLIDELNEKLAYKSFINSKLYFDMDYYKSAIVAIENSLKDFPTSKYREEQKFLLLKSKYLFGINSIEEKKRERMNQALDEYYTFVDEFPNSKYVKEAKRYFKSTSEYLGYDSINLKSTEEQ